MNNEEIKKKILQLQYQLKELYLGLKWKISEMNIDRVRNNYNNKQKIQTSIVFTNGYTNKTVYVNYQVFMVLEKFNKQNVKFTDDEINLLDIQNNNSEIKKEGIILR